jgi:ribosomal protein L16/L10AE
MKPKSTKFKKYHKPYLKNYYNYKTNLIYSQYALVTTETSLITASQLEAVTLAIKNALNRKLDVVGFKNLKILVGVILMHSCLHDHLLLNMN